MFRSFAYNNNANSPEKMYVSQSMSDAVPSLSPDCSCVFTGLAPITYKHVVIDISIFADAPLSNNQLPSSTVFYHQQLAANPPFGVWVLVTCMFRVAATQFSPRMVSTVSVTSYPILTPQPILRHLWHIEGRDFQRSEYDPLKAPALVHTVVPPDCESTPSRGRYNLKFRYFTVWNHIRTFRVMVCSISCPRGLAAKSLGYPGVLKSKDF